MSTAFLIFIILICICCIKDSFKIHKYISFILELKRNISNENNQKSFSSKPKKRKLSKLSTKRTKLIKSNLDIYYKEKGKSLKKKCQAAPIKKEKIKNKNSVIEQSNIPINNNILLNVQVITPTIKNHKNSIFSPYKISSKKKISHKSLKSLNSEFNTKKHLILDSQKLFKNNNNIDLKKYRLLNDYEINNLQYEIAIKIDKRKYIQYYWSLLKYNQIILFTFCLKNDYNLLTVKIILFLISFCLYFTINGFFFDDKTMRGFYKNKGSYNFLSNLPQILYSTIITAFINIILKRLSLSQYYILDIKDEAEYQRAFQKSEKSEFKLKINLIIFFILSSIFMLFFWYFISCFCAVFPNTQIILIIDTVFTFILSTFDPFLIYLIPGIFRISSLRSKKSNKECLYKFGQIIALL